MKSDLTVNKHDKVPTIVMICESRLKTRKGNNRASSDIYVEVPTFELENCILDYKVLDKDGARASWKSTNVSGWDMD